MASFSKLYNIEARMTDPRSYSQGFGNVNVGQGLCLSIAMGVYLSTVNKMVTNTRLKSV
jgi:hypothetical protein